MDSHFLPVKQERSRRTLDRLLDAAEEVLADAGLEAATVPEIVRRAGLSVGVVYRRVPDKDALLRAVYERFFERASAHNATALEPSRWAGRPLAAIVRSLVGGMVTAYRHERSILRALITYADTHPDPVFRRRAAELNADAFRRIGALLLVHRDAIRHPDPELAIDFGLGVIAFALKGMTISESTLLPASTRKAERLGEELTRVFLGYLGVGG